MKTVKKIVAMAMAVTLSALCITGCGKEESKNVAGNAKDKKTTLTLYIPGYGDAVYGDAYDVSINAFEKENPDIDIDVIGVSWDDAMPKMISMIQGGDTPDMMIMGSQELYPIVKMEALEPLDSYVSEEKKSQYIGSLFDTGKVNGVQYGVPMGFSSRALYYRKDLIKEPPKTWDELVSVAKKVQEENPDMKGYAVPGTIDGATETQFGNFLLQAGGDFYDEKGNPTLNTKEALDAFKFYTGLYTEQGVVPNPVDISRDDLGDLFKNGQIAMFTNGPWVRNTMELEPDNEKTPYGVALLPKGKVLAETLVTDSITISSSSKHKEEAYKFIEFMTQYEYQNKFDESVGFFPLYKEEMKEDRYKEDFYKPFMDMVQYGKPGPVPPVFEEFEEIIVKAVQKTVLGEKTAEEALKEAQQLLEELSKK